MKVVVLGDVGTAMEYHAGDDAMFDSAIEHIRLMGSVEVTAISDEPSLISRRYGVHAISAFGFAPGPGSAAAARRERRLEEILNPDEDPGVWAEPSAESGVAAAAIRAADGLIITGGGNLCSAWPDRVFERAAALRVAEMAGVPAVLTSQTMGPMLSARETAILVASSAAVRMVGLRESRSLRLAANLWPSTPRRLQVDDAIDLPEGQVDHFDNDHLLADGFVALTVHPLGQSLFGDRLLVGLSQLVRHIWRRTGLPVAFLPHVGRFDGESAGDVEVGRALSQLVGHGPNFVLCPVLPARQLASLTRRASAIVSTRYHPIVFGLAGGSPCLGLYQDLYTETKITGALQHAGLQAWRLPVDSLTTGLPTEAFDELWRRRDELSDHIAEVTPGWLRGQDRHWAELWDAIADPSRARPVVPATEHVDMSGPRPDEASIGPLNQIMAHHHEQASENELQWRNAFSEAEEYALDLEVTLSERTKELSALRIHLEAVDDDRQIAARALETVWARVDELEARLVQANDARASAAADAIGRADEAMRSEASARAARAMVAELQSRVADVRTEILASKESAAVANSEKDALLATKTFRWLRPFRQCYGALLRVVSRSARRRRCRPPTGVPCCRAEQLRRPVGNTARRQGPVRRP